MENNKLNKEIKIIYENTVKYDKPKFDTKITITETVIRLEKKKGLFKRVYKMVDSINVEDIKVYKDKVQVHNEDKEVEIETYTKSYKVVCNNVTEAKRLTEEIIKIKTGTNLIEKTSSKIIKIGTSVAKTATSIGSVVASVGAVAIAINKNKDEIEKAIKVVKDIIKK